MSLLSENVVPDNNGKIFTTNAETEDDLKDIKQLLLWLKGVDEVQIDKEKYPRELIVRTNKMVSVKEIEEHVATLGFDIIPKGIFAM